MKRFTHNYTGQVGIPMAGLREPAAIRFLRDVSQIGSGAGGGAGGVSYAVVPFVLNTGIGNQDITTADLNEKVPDAALFVVVGATVDFTITAHARISIGATDFTSQWATSFYSESALADTECAAYTSDTELIVMSDLAAGTDASCTIVSAIAGGARINVDNAGSAWRGFAVFFCDTQGAKCGTTDPPGVSSAAVTGIGFEALTSASPT